jgi:hypothetical protein
VTSQPDQQSQWYHQVSHLPNKELGHLWYWGKRTHLCKFLPVSFMPRTFFQKGTSKPYQEHSQRKKTSDSLERWFNTQQYSYHSK